MFKEDYAALWKSYPSFDLKELSINRIEADDGYTYLFSIYQRLKSISESLYYPECQKILRKIKILVVENKIFASSQK